MLKYIGMLAVKSFLNLIAMPYIIKLKSNSIVFHFKNKGRTLMKVAYTTFQNFTVDGGSVILVPKYYITTF